MLQFVLKYFVGRTSNRPFKHFPASPRGLVAHNPSAERKPSLHSVVKEVTHAFSRSFHFTHTTNWRTACGADFRHVADLMRWHLHNKFERGSRGEHAPRLTSGPVPIRRDQR